MRKVKLIVHENYQGKRKSEDVFVEVFLSNATALTKKEKMGIQARQHHGSDGYYYLPVSVFRKDQRTGIHAEKCGIWVQYNLYLYLRCQRQYQDGQGRVLYHDLYLR